MTETPGLAAGRYTVTGRLDDRRLRGHDRRLGRDVLLWEFESTEEAARARNLTLAGSFARLTHPVFLQTLDLFEEGPRVVLVLEAPEVEPGTDHPLEQGLPALVAATLTLRIGAALEEAAKAGLAVDDLELKYVHLSGTDEVRLDPAGLLRLDEQAASGLVSLLTRFLASFLPGDRPRQARSRFDPGADAAAGFVARWRERAERGEADGPADLTAFLEELRLLARSPADLYVHDDAGFQRHEVAGGVPPPGAADEEQTVPLALPSARRNPAADTGETSPPPAPPAPAHEARPGPARRRSTGRTRRSPLSALVGLGLVAALAVGLVAVGLSVRDRQDGATAEVADVTTASPTPAPPDRATLVIAAQQDARMRVYVDAALAFDGVLRAGESRSWDGRSRVHVWTDNGKNISVTVNGFVLGPLSPAVGHPEWNTVDWGWPAGWRPQ